MLVIIGMPLNVIIEWRLDIMHSVKLEEGLVVELMDEGFLVDLVAELEFGGEITNFLELSADALETRDVFVVVAPQRDSVVLVPDRKDSSVDQLNALLWELPPDNTQQQMQPCLPALFFHVFLDG